MKRVVSAVVIACALGSQARADTIPDPSFMYDGEAVSLIWLPLVGGLTLHATTAPRATPLLFSAHDGGATPARWEVPGWSLAVIGGGVATSYVLGGGSARWYHAKGLTEAMATSELAVSILKPMFGRHRPDWVPKSLNRNEDESFPSGHTTEAFAMATYSALYLHDHVAGNHALAYAGIFSAAGLIATERVLHHRHFISDVVAGAVLGSTISALIYQYQDKRASGVHVTDPVAPPALGSPSALTFSGVF